jgi:hypothetical protein
MVNDHSEYEESLQQPTEARRRTSKLLPEPPLSPRRDPRGNACAGIVTRKRRARQPEDSSSAALRSTTAPADYDPQSDYRRWGICDDPRDKYACSEFSAQGSQQAFESASRTEGGIENPRRAAEARASELAEAWEWGQDTQQSGPFNVATSAPQSERRYSSSIYSTTPSADDPSTASSPVHGRAGSTRGTSSLGSPCSTAGTALRNPPTSPGACSRWSSDSSDYGAEDASGSADGESRQSRGLTGRVRRSLQSLLRRSRKSTTSSS